MHTGVQQTVSQVALIALYSSAVQLRIGSAIRRYEAVRLCPYGRFSYVMKARELANIEFSLSSLNSQVILHAEAMLLYSLFSFFRFKI